MDTKWKRFRIILSFAAFFVGMSLLISNFISMLGLIAGSDLEEFRRRTGTDYQETQEFSDYIGGRLEELLCVAVGGKGWKSYGVAYEEGYVQDYPWYWFGDTAVGTDEEITEEIIEQAESAEQAYTEAVTGNGYEAEPQSDEEALKAYMQEFAKNKNLRYAVIYKGKLLYTNIDEIEAKIGEEIGISAPAAYAPEEEYNFSLWFNLDGDGKVQITKDGKGLDIYGDGVYTEDSRWYVPGYTNFNVDESAKDAVIFMAVARDPKLYVSGNYSGGGTYQYGGRLYYMQKNQLAFREQFQAGCLELIAAVLLLILTFFLRKDKRLADQAVARFLGKIWIEVKVLLFVIVPAALFLFSIRDFLSELMWLLRDSWYYLEEAVYTVGRLAANSLFLTAGFWLIYLAVLDLRANKGRQKKLFAPLIDSLRAKELKLPVQKRMVKRCRMVLLPGFLEIASGIVFIFMLIGGFGYMGGRYWVAGAAVIFGALFFLTSVWHFWKNRRIAEDIGALSDQIEAVRAGNLTEALELPEDTDLKEAAENLNEIQQGMERALREQMQSERMKVELIANVSHDIKTPLTSIVSYVELLKQEEDLPDHVRDYIQILGEKSERLKTMVQDVFEVSKATSGQLPVNMEELDLGKLLRQTLADMNIQIEESGLTLKISIPEAPVMIRADGQRLYRVFQNLLQNALKYSLKGSRIFLTLTDDGKTAIASVKNTSGTELDHTVDFTERFVRGDASRTDGGSGLGLSIARSFTEACGGQFKVETNADLFTVTVIFSKLSC